MITRTNTLGILALALLMSAILVLTLSTGCARTATPSASQPVAAPAPKPKPAVDKSREVIVYFVRNERLGAAVHQVEATQAMAAAALRELLAGPTAEERKAGLASEIPVGTRLLGVTIEDGTATVDLSEEFESGGGSLSMTLRVAQVVYTLTAFPTVENVAFRIDGEPVEAIGGEGISVSPPVTRLDFADNVSPAILLESPAPWQEVKSPIRLTGMSNTFEATFLYNIIDPSGLVVAEGFVTATSGSGTWGTFDATVEYETSGEGVGSILVFEESAEDGSRINLVKIPVRMTR